MDEEMIKNLSIFPDDYLRAVEKSREEDRKRWKQQRRQELLELLGVLLLAVLAAMPLSFLLAMLAVKAAGG